MKSNKEKKRRTVDPINKPYPLCLLGGLGQILASCLCQTWGAHQPIMLSNSIYWSAIVACVYSEVGDERTS